MLQQSFPELLKTYRKTMGWTQEELAKEWSYSSDAISAWERGIRTPGGQQVPRIARLLNIPPDELVKIIHVVQGRTIKGNTPIVGENEQEFKLALEAWGELQHIYLNRTEFNREISYPRIFEDAHEIFAVGISLNALAMNYSQEKMIKSIIEKKSTITLCFLDPNGVHCAERELEENLSPGRLSLLTQLNIANIETIKKNIRKIDPESDERLKIMIYDLPPRFNIYVVDNVYLTVQTYAYGRGEDTPTFVLRRQINHSLFDYYVSTARHIFDQAKAI